MAELDISHFKKPVRLVEADTSPGLPENCSPHVHNGEILPQEPAERRQAVNPPVGDGPPLLEAVRVESLVPSIFRGIDLEAIETRTDLIRALTRNIPTNDYHLVDYFLRPDLLDVNTFLSALRGPTLPTNNSPETRWNSLQALVNNATIHLDYAQGFPAFDKGIPFWGQLPHETKEAHAAFLMYADLEGARTLQDLGAYPLDLLNEWFHQNYWAMRVNAMDMFRAAHHARLRERRIMSLEGDHYAAGEKIFRQIMKAIEGKTADDWNGVDLKDLVTMIGKVAPLQRVSLGLSASGGGEREPVKNQSVEVIMRQVALGNGERKETKEEDSFDVLLGDPEAVEAAQELILRIGHK